MTEAEIRRIVREEIKAEMELAAAERKAKGEYCLAKWAAIAAEVNRRIEAEGSKHAHCIMAEVQRRFDNDPTFLRN